MFQLLCRRLCFHGHSIASAGGNKISYLYPRSAFGYDAKTFYSNLPTAGARRGYGAPQVIFALECMLMMPAPNWGWIRSMCDRQRGARGGCQSVNQKTIYSAGLPDCLRRGREMFEWDRLKAECLGQDPASRVRRGIGVACFSYGSNTYPVGVEIAGARMLLLNQDGTVNLQIGATEIGQGSDTVFAQMAAQTLAFRLSRSGSSRLRIPTSPPTIRVCPLRARAMWRPPPFIRRRCNCGRASSHGGPALPSGCGIPDPDRWLWVWPVRRTEASAG